MPLAWLIVFTEIKGIKSGLPTEDCLLSKPVVFEQKKTGFCAFQNFLSQSLQFCTLETVIYFLFMPFDPFDNLGPACDIFLQLMTFELANDPKPACDI